MEEQVFSLRPLTEKDAQRMVEMMQDAQTTQYLQIGGPDYTLDTALGFIRIAGDESKNLHRAVVDREDVYQGSVSLKHIDLDKKEAEYAISMHPQAQGKGAAKAASAGILELAWSIGLERVYLNVLARNERANRFYQKFGFRYTHTTDMEFRGSTEKLHWYECRREA
jgi:RimJ/RimL family protein N-acetyltransferase